MNAWISQSLETRDVVRFQGQPVTVSFWYRIPTSFTLNWTARIAYNTSVDTRISSDIVSSSFSTIVTLPNQSAWTYASFTGFIPASTQSLTLQFVTVNSTVNGAQFQLTGVQLEKGTVATPFEVRPFATELALCQRYYEQSYSIGTAPGTNTNIGLYLGYGASDASSNFDFIQRYQVPKRITVTPSFYEKLGFASGAWNYSRSGATSNTAVSGVTTYSNEQYWGGYVNVGAAWAPCNVYGHWVANAEL